MIYPKSDHYKKIIKLYSLVATSVGNVYIESDSMWYQVAGKSIIPYGKLLSLAISGARFML